MSEKHPKTSGAPASPVSASPARGVSALENNAGRVTFDSRGNAVWEWRTDDGEFHRDASTSMVRALQPVGLSIEATMRVKRPAAGPVAKDQMKAPLSAAQPRADVTGGSGATLRLESPATGRTAGPGPGRELSGFDPYNSGRDPRHLLRESRRSATKPSRGPVTPERKSLFARLIGRKS